MSNTADNCNCQKLYPGPCDLHPYTISVTPSQSPKDSVSAGNNYQAIAGEIIQAAQHGPHAQALIIMALENAYIAGRASRDGLRKALERHPCDSIYGPCEKLDERNKCWRCSTLAQDDAQ